jgi:hypothetical protein
LNIESPYDYVIANSVFLYLGLDYAAEVLDRMTRKANIAVAILDVPDFQTKGE